MRPTNHGSLSDRIMNRYGDTPMGMCESTLEFIVLRVRRLQRYYCFYEVIEPNSHGWGLIGYYPVNSSEHDISIPPI